MLPPAPAIKHHPRRQAGADFPRCVPHQRLYRQRNVKTDSLRIYEPIFARYGYTTDDVHYTIGNFSKRKSARLGDIVERAIEMLEREGKFYNREVAVLDTIDNVARRTFTRAVLADSLIRVRSLADTARLSFSLDVEPGDYQLSLRYLVDSLDRNDKGLKGSVWLERRDSTRTGVYTTDPAAQPRGDFLAPFHRRFVAPPPAHRLPELHGQAPAPLGDGHRPEGRIHASDAHGGRKALRTATRYPYFRR